MSNKRSETSRGEESSDSDDLRLINGIGPTVERRLHGVGIYTYAHLAALSPADIAAAIGSTGGLTSERIIKEDWIGQAHKRATESRSSEAREEVEAPVEPVIPLIVSQVELVAPGDENVESVPPVVAEPELAASAVEVIEPAAPLVAPPGAKEAHILPPVVAMTGTPYLHQIETKLADAQIPLNFFAHDQPFNIYLTLDLSRVRVPDDTQFSYRAFIYSKSLEGLPHQAVSETSGTVTCTDKVIVSVEGIVLPKGTYRLKAIVILNSMTTEPTLQSGLIASKESDLLLIF